MCLDLRLVEALLLVLLVLLRRLWLRCGALRPGWSLLLWASSSEFNPSSTVLYRFLRSSDVLLTMKSFSFLSLMWSLVYLESLHLLLPPFSLLARYESLLLISLTSPPRSAKLWSLSLSSLWSLPLLSRYDNRLFSMISPWKLCLVVEALWKLLWRGWESLQETSLPWSTWLSLLWGPSICSDAPSLLILTGTPLSLRTWPSIAQTLLPPCTSLDSLLDSSWKRTCLSALSLQLHVLANSLLLCLLLSCSLTDSLRLHRLSLPSSNLDSIPESLNLWNSSYSFLGSLSWCQIQGLLFSTPPFSHRSSSHPSLSSSQTLSSSGKLQWEFRLLYFLSCGCCKDPCRLRGDVWNLSFVLLDKTGSPEKTASESSESSLEGSLNLLLNSLKESVCPSFDHEVLFSGAATSLQGPTFVSAALERP